jgi:hypothetical protein
MKKLAALILLIAIGLCTSLGVGEAAWKKRGWYVKKPGAHCVLRNVAASSANGKVMVQKVRVCR